MTPMTHLTTVKDNNDLNEGHRQLLIWYYAICFICIYIFNRLVQLLTHPSCHPSPMKDLRTSQAPFLSSCSYADFTTLNLITTSKRSKHSPLLWCQLLWMIGSLCSKGTPPPPPHTNTLWCLRHAVNDPTSHKKLLCNRDTKLTNRIHLLCIKNCWHIVNRIDSGKRNLHVPTHSQKLLSQVIAVVVGWCIRCPHRHSFC